MAFLSRESGVRLYYEVHGKSGGAETEASALILSHAYGATSGMWRDQIEVLSAERRVIVWDMRGHGQSETPDDSASYSRDLTLGDMEALQDACGIEKAIMGGLSMGGYMSLAFGLLRPERVSALMLCDSGPGFRSEKSRAAWNKQAEKQAEVLEKKGLAAQPYAPNAVHRDAQSLAHAARGMLAHGDSLVMERLAEIDLPTLIVVGGNDKPFLGASAYMARKIEGARHVIVPDAGHYANADAPEAFNASVMSFLGN